MSNKRRALFITLVVLGVTAGTLTGSYLQLREAVAATSTKAKPAPKSKLAPTAPVRVVNKIVPILSLGSGARVGLCQITGPAANIDKAKMVGQIETTFQDVVRIRIFVPIKTQEGLDRVPQVNVNAYADLKL